MAFPPKKYIDGEERKYARDYTSCIGFLQTRSHNVPLHILPSRARTGVRAPHPPSIPSLYGATRKYRYFERYMPVFLACPKGRLNRNLRGRWHDPPCILPLRYYAHRPSYTVLQHGHSRLPQRMEIRRA